MKLTKQEIRLLPSGTLVINPTNGETNRIKWVSHDHVQFEVGSCSVKNFSMFYSACDVVRPGECKEWLSGDERTKIVDNSGYASA